MANSATTTQGYMRRRYRGLVVSLLLMAVLVLVQPVLWRVVRSRAEVVHARRTIEQQRLDTASRVDLVRGDIEARQESLGIIDAVTPPFTQLPQAVERLELLAERRGLSLEIQGINQVSVSSEDAVMPVTVSVRVFGPVEILFEFMEQLEHVQELTRIENWQLQPTTAPPSVAVIDSAANYLLSADVVFFLQNETYGSQ